MKEQTKPDFVVAPRTVLGYSVAEAIMIDAISKCHPAPVIQFVSLGFRIFDPSAIANLYHSAIIPAQLCRSVQIMLDAYPSFPFAYYKADEMEKGEGGWSWLNLTNGAGESVNKIAVLPVTLPDGQAPSSEKLEYVEELVGVLNHASVPMRELILSRISAEDLGMLRCPVSEIENFRIARHIAWFDVQGIPSLIEKYQFKVGAEASLTNSEKTYIHRLNEEKD